MHYTHITYTLLIYSLCNYSLIIFSHNWIYPHMNSVLIVLITHGGGEGGLSKDYLHKMSAYGGRVSGKTSLCPWGVGEH